MSDYVLTDEQLMTEMIRCETAIWDALVSGDMTQDAAGLDAAFLGVYPDGFANKNAHVQQLANGPTIATYEIDASQAMWLGPNHALLSYRATYQRTSGPAPEVMYVSSIWKRKGAGWISVFSQDTPAACETE